MKSSQSNFNLRSPDAYLVCSYLITTVRNQVSKTDFSKIFHFLKLCSNAMICTKILIALNVPFEVFIAWIILVTGLFWFICKIVCICLSKHQSMYHEKKDWHKTEIDSFPVSWTCQFVKVCRDSLQKLSKYFLFA